MCRSLHVLVLGNCGRNKRKYNEDVAAGWSRGCKQKAKSLRSQSSRDAAEWVTIEGQIGHSWSLLPIGSSTTETPSSLKTLEFSLPSLLFFIIASNQNTTYGSLEIIHDEPVFALRVEETRPMAGRPIWKTRSEYTERLGISRGYIRYVAHPWHCVRVDGVFAMCNG